MLHFKFEIPNLPWFFRLLGVRGICLVESSFTSQGVPMHSGLRILNLCGIPLSGMPWPTSVYHHMPYCVQFAAGSGIKHMFVHRCASQASDACGRCAWGA